MTNEDILKIYTSKYPDAKVEDYRPICRELFTKDRAGITIWLQNGDIIEYYPKEGERIKGRLASECAECTWFEKARPDEYPCRDCYERREDIEAITMTKEEEEG